MLYVGMLFPPLPLNFTQGVNTESRLSVPACCTDVGLSLVSLPGAVQCEALIRDPLSGAVRLHHREERMLQAH